MSLSVAVTSPVTPGYEGTFIPTLWSSKLNQKFYAATVLAEISNTDYEGEIKKQGDTVKIRTIPNLNIVDYQRGMTLPIQRPDQATIDLVINKGKAFNAELDDVSKYQSDLNLLDEWTRDASEQMKIAIDTDVLANVYTQVAATNKGNSAGASGGIVLGATGAGVQLTKTNVIDTLVDCGQVLDEQNIPESDRFLVIPPWVAALIKKSDLKNVYMTGDDTSPVRNGRLGMIDRFTLYVSNLLPTVTDTTLHWHILGGQKSALTFAAQMTEMETIRSTTTFANTVRGLQVYGYKVTKPAGLFDLYAKR